LLALPNWRAIVERTSTTTHPPPPSSVGVVEALR